MKRPRTALVLSGGGSRGSYQIGVWKALKKLRVKIDIVTGSSVGAINGSMVVLDQFGQAEDFWLNAHTAQIFDLASAGTGAAGKIERLTGKTSIMGMPIEEIFGYAREILKEGGAGSDGLLGILHSYIDEDALRRSGKDYGIVAAEAPSLKGRYIFKEDIPYGQLHDYILASASCFPAAKYQEIGGRKFIDGGYADNLPVAMAMAKKPERIIAVDLQAPGRVIRKNTEAAEKHTGEFILIRSCHDLGNFLAFDKENAERNIRLGYLDAMKVFGRYRGTFCTFRKSGFDENELKEADAAGDIFGADPLEIYTKRAFDRMLAGKLAGAFPLPLLPEASADLRSLLPHLKDTLSKENLAASIAADMLKNKEKSIFLSSIALKHLQSHIMAAHYISKKKWFLKSLRESMPDETRNHLSSF